MTTLKACVQKQRADGFYPVYIRVIHGRQSGFIKTDKVVSKKSVSKNREIRDNAVLKYCTELIESYIERLNRQDTANWSVKEVIAFLQTQDNDASFSDYAKKHIARLINTGHERTSKNYKLAVQHLERYLGSTELKFSQLTSAVLNRWIASMAQRCEPKRCIPSASARYSRQHSLN